MTPQIPAAFLLIVVLASFLTGWIWFPSYTGLSRGKSILALLGSLIPTLLYIARSAGHLSGGGGFRNQDALLVAVLAGAIFSVLVAALVLRLWGRWVGEKGTDSERAPGVPGIRAWFCTSNVFVGILIVASGWLSFELSPLLSAVTIGALLAAQPLILMEHPARIAAPVPVDHSPEREKILAMLETGKLTPDESAELLQALGDSARVPAPPIPLTSGQRLLLIGAALVALGFFLPWFVIDPGKEADRMMNRMQSSMRSSFGGNIEMPVGFPGVGPAQLKTGSVSISGGDIQRGLGWAALLLALAAAFLPYVATALDPATARTIRLLCLGIGGIIVLYLLTQNLRFVGIGLILAVGGYVLEAVGVFRERRAAGVSSAA